MRKTAIAVCVLVLMGVISAGAQETYFGKNKVRYKDFDWDYIQTRHFDIHFYENAYPTAKFAAAVLESSYVEISRELNYRIQQRVPIFVYNSHNDFQQTNVTSGLISEGTGGFTEIFKKRIVIPFTGNYEDFRHVLHHELTHAVTFDMLYGNILSTLLSRQRFFVMPLWFAEGYAEYSARHGWDYWSDMVVRDATINNYLQPISSLGGYLAYKEGQALIKFIAEEYGEDKLGMLLHRGKTLMSMSKAIKKTLGITEKELWKKFSKEMKRRYWPEIAKRKEADEIAKQLTHAKEDGSYFNEKPAFSPDGDRLAIFTDRFDYTEIVLISVDTAKVIKRLVKGARSGDLESLHSYVSGMSFSPDGENIAFVAKSKGKDAIFFHNIEKNKTYKKKRFDFYNILSPMWSPDGKQLVFSATSGNRRDLYIYDLESDQTEQITDDRYDDVDPSWLPTSDGLVFASDRPHPQNPTTDDADHMYVNRGAYKPGGFEYGYYNLFKIDLGNRVIEPVDVGPGQNRMCAVSPNGGKVAFVSNRNGIDNIYVGYLDSVKHFAVTDLLTGVKSISWSPDGQELAFEAFYRGAFDVFLLKDLVPVGEDGVLEPTAFVKGDYDLLDKGREHTKEIATSLDKHKDSAERGQQGLISDGKQSEADSSGDGGEIVSATEEAEDSPDTVITETGIYDDEYVHTVASSATDPLDSLLEDIPDRNDPLVPMPPEEPASFDSIPPLKEDGEFSIGKYKVRFTPDYVGGGFAYDTFFGLRGQSYFVFSDYLGNHQIVLATDLVNTIDQSNFQAFYFNNKKRTRFGVGFFHTKNFYLDNQSFLFSDRFYGFQASASRPFSTFSRVEVVGAQFFIDRNYYDFDDIRPNRSVKVSTLTLAHVTDNVLWGLTGPVNGHRSRVAIEGGLDFFDASDIEFAAAEFDYRKYWHFQKTISFALRFSGGMSFGRTPKQYFLGGTTNWIGSRTLDAEVYEVENLYFSQIVTPLRGVPYYELAGDRYGLMNAEVRFPMIEYFAMRFPLPIVISRVQGAIFTDIGAAWDGNNFKGGTSRGGTNRLQDIKTGFGFGMRTGIGFVLLRYDLAWSTDFHSVSDKPQYYFSLGADF